MQVFRYPNHKVYYGHARDRPFFEIPCGFNVACPPGRFRRPTGENQDENSGVLKQLRSSTGGDGS